MRKWCPVAEKFVTEGECGRTHAGLIALFSAVGVLLLGAGGVLWSHDSRITGVEVKADSTAKQSEETAKKLDDTVNRIEIKLDRVLTCVPQKP